MSDQEDKLRQTMKVFDLLGNLPGIGQPLGKFHGYNLPVHLPLIWNDIYNIDFQSNDVIVASFPKSGTHWVYYIVYLLKTRNFGPVPFNQQRPLLEIPYTPTLLKEFIESPSPRVICTHLPEPLLPKKAFDAKLIHVYRNPKDIVVSKYHHYLSMTAWPYSEPFDVFARRFIRGETFWGPYPDYLRDMLKAKSEGKPMLCLKYEQLKKDLRGGVKQIADFLGEKIDDELLEKITNATTADAMKQNNDANAFSLQTLGIWKKGVPFIRKGESGGWREYFKDPQLVAEFDEFIAKTVPREFLSTFDE